MVNSGVRTNFIVLPDILLKNELFGFSQEWCDNVPFYPLYFVSNRTGIGICLQWWV